MGVLFHHAFQAFQLPEYVFTSYNYPEMFVELPVRKIRVLNLRLYVGFLVCKNYLGFNLISLTVFPILSILLIFGLDDISQNFLT